MKNANSREALEATKLQVLQHLARLPAKPSAQFQEVPPEAQLVSTDWHTTRLRVWAGGRPSVASALWRQLLRHSCWVKLTPLAAMWAIIPQYVAKLPAKLSA